ncbi:MAG: vitamin B12-dependent ribonucleotide reductase [Clostridia bacterium]|nr:vitamin B12-dependent ribonucleotide reductase [Clostridia bacterium]
MEVIVLEAQKKYDFYQKLAREGKLIKPDFSPNALKVIEKRYLRRDAKGEIMENPQEMLIRVAENIAAVDHQIYNKPLEEVEKSFLEFYEMMAKCYFLPNSPTLMNAGTSVQQLSACFVLPVEDNMEGIFDSLKWTALVHKSGGGTGFSFSRLRPKNDIVSSTGGEASGPISFMNIFNSATEEVKQGGKRRGANMGILRVDHPDILEFITCKDVEGKLNNFNISVAITDEFMEALINEDTYKLYNPKDGSVAGELNAKEVFRKIVYQAWKNGEPGVIFIDKINKDNPTPHIGAIESTNPCGEQPLLPFESCNLGSINLEKFVIDGKIDYERLERVVKTSVHFLDNVIDANQYPIPQIEKMTKGNRKIGLGVMGWANALILMGIPYDSQLAVQKAEEVMEFIDRKAKEASRELARERGAFPNFEGSVYDLRNEEPIRNATVTTIAPTGSISMIANTSSGIEPLFGVVYKSYRADTEFIEVNALFEEIARRRGFWSDDLPRKILEAGTVKGISEIPRDIQELFVTSGEISAQWHIRMQAAFQVHCDNAVSKTINFANSATVEDIAEAYLLAYRLNCKGLTVYRDGSREFQVLNKGNDNKKEQNPEEERLEIRPRKRPQVMAGISSGYQSACSKFYVTVNGNGEPFEVFCNSTGQGGCQAQTNAIATLVTLLLRCGVAIDEITKRLRRIQCSACIRREGIDVISCPAAIGQAIELYMQNKKGIQFKPEQLLIPFDEGVNKEETKKGDGITTCPDCGSKLMYQEGCRGCSNPGCSFHKCG